jgi:hypothetical protein
MATVVPGKTSMVCDGTDLSNKLLSLDLRSDKKVKLVLKMSKTVPPAQFSGFEWTHIDKSVWSVQIPCNKITDLAMCSYVQQIELA